MGSEWSQAAQFITRYNDDEIAAADQHSCLLGSVEYASSETSTAFVNQSEDISAEEFFEALLDAIISKASVEDLALRLSAEHWE